MISPESAIFVAGNRGMVGSALIRRLAAGGYRNIITAGRDELDLLDQAAVRAFMDRKKPAWVVVAAAKVGGIHANNTFRADFLYENLVIETGYGVSTGGRRPLTYALEKNKMYLVSVAMDQFVTKIAIMDMQNNFASPVEKVVLPL